MRKLMSALAFTFASHAAMAQYYVPNYQTPAPPAYYAPPGYTQMPGPGVGGTLFSGPPAPFYAPPPPTFNPPMIGSCPGGCWGNRE